MLSKAQGMFLDDEAFIFQYSRWRWLFRWLWLNFRWIPVVLLLCLVRWRRLKSGKIVEFRVSEMTPVGDGGFRCIVGCAPALIPEAVKAMEAWATRGYSVVGVKHVVDIRCRFFFGLPVVGLWV
ncbi:hypothetical protein Bca4012_047520 [Brassica carinata]